MSTASIISIGTASPDGAISQRDAAEITTGGMETPDRDRAVHALFRRAGVYQRGSVLVNLGGDQSFYSSGDGPDPTTAQRMRVFREHAHVLGARACRVAIDRAGLASSAITHIVTASCTGFHAPGPDLLMLRELGLSPGVRRTSVGFMGCHAAINAVAVADAYARSDPDARVLVCCTELCTLHMTRSSDPDRFVANALFSDGAGALVVARSDANGARIAGTDSVVIPGSEDQMTWAIGDHGFEMSLSPRVPTTLSAHVPSWIDRVLTGVSLDRDSVGHWAIHPGGPRVLSTLAEALGLDDDATEVSRRVLRDHGNMSSATIVFILERILERGISAPVCSMAFGPGLAGESLVLTPNT